MKLVRARDLVSMCELRSYGPKTPPPPEREPTPAPKDVHDDIIKWLEIAKVAVRDTHKLEFPTLDEEILSWERGKKYYRVSHGREGHRSVWCFIDFEGNIYKAEGRNKPAKGVRYTIYNKDPKTVHWNTGWLYYR